MSVADDDGLLHRLFLVDRVILGRARIDPISRNICRGPRVLIVDRRVLRIPVKSLLETVAVITLFCLTPMIAACALISLARVVENIGDLPIDERKTLAVRHWAGGSAS